MKYIDKDTTPNCKVEKKKFEWGESYNYYTPIFSIKNFSKSNLKNSIIIFGENNFKKQLLLIYNAIINHDEFEKLKNYKYEEIKRTSILELINYYFKKNETLISP
ncbi:hypothetical protein EG240_15885 [Paenimyroides tangerinum]|uniref:Uncharacterized protein n=1 Tax=Paenimyroides tangerinum TaxID=2488728 RepID=A0A3P3VXC1_9FLAO|nr:hypothetical protein [Paenimyroides tangerinum]RRJ86698.1 hypothetical protein EG240_15885 [Paenimyroides tangerinum]